MLRAGGLGEARVILVTSPMPRDGKSTTVANLAYALAQAGKSVMVVDGDMRLPSLHGQFRLANVAGLSNYLAQTASLDQVTLTSGIPGLKVITSGPRPENPAELLASPAMAVLVERLSKQYDVTLIDSPALNSVSDAAEIAALTDGVLLVVSRQQCSRAGHHRARRILGQVRGRALGVVVNRGRADAAYRHYG